MSNNLEEDVLLGGGKTSRGNSGKKVETSVDDAGDFAENQNRLGNSAHSNHEDDEMKPPQHPNICQWVIIAILYLIFAFLVGFIIYISSTWNKDRTNEYT